MLPLSTRNPVEGIEKHGGADTFNGAAAQGAAANGRSSATIFSQ